MRPEIKEILGKTITGVMVIEREKGEPKNMLILAFDDRTHYEVYAADEIMGTRGVEKGGLDLVAGRLDKELRVIFREER